MLVALGLALLTGACWCTVGIAFSQAADRGHHPALMNLLCFCGVALVTTYGIEWSALGSTTPAVVVSMCISGMAMTGGMAALQVAMKRGGHGVAWAVAQSGLVWPFVSAVVFHGERPGALPWFGLLCVVASLALLAERREPADGEGTGRWFPLALLAWALIGVQQSAFQWPSLSADTPDRAGIRLPLMFTVAAMSATLLLACRQRDTTNVAPQRSLTSVARLALLGCTASLIAQPAIIQCSDRLAAIGAAGIAFPVAIVTCIALFTAYTCLHRGERPPRRAYAGLGACIVGVVLMCI